MKHLCEIKAGAHFIYGGIKDALSQEDKSAAEG